jgi:hypothetical protein
MKPSPAFLHKMQLAGFVNALGLLWKRLNQEISKSHCPIHPAIPRKKRHFNTAATCGNKHPAKYWVSHISSLFNPRSITSG